MSFSLDLTEDQIALRDKAHAFAQEVIRPVASEYDRAQEFPWPVIEEAARHGLYGWELYAQLAEQAMHAAARPFLAIHSLTLSPRPWLSRFCRRPPRNAICAGSARLTRALRR